MNITRLRPPLTVRNAEIKTAAVEIRTLTVSGKQVTLAVFRQLRDERLVNRDGSLNGMPWGTVNYHPDKCADLSTHLHVVWQRGAELLRSTVWIPSNQHSSAFLEKQFPSRVRSKSGDAALTLGVYQALQKGRQPFTKDELKVLLEHDGKRHRTARQPDALHFYPVQVLHPVGAQAAWLSLKDKTAMWQGIYSVEYAFREKILELESEVPAWVHTDGGRESIAVNQGRTYGAILERIMPKLGAICAGYRGVESKFEQELTAETAIRQKYIEAVDALGCLPQLFIAV